MDELSGFLAARYDEAWARASAATQGVWHPRSDDRDPNVETLTDGEWSLVVGVVGEADAQHIAAVDPAHRLRDITLKRAILAEYVSFREESAKGDVGPGLHMGTQVLGDAVRQLGTEFSDHPDYKPGWVPEGA